MHFRLVGRNQNPFSYSESLLLEDLFSFLSVLGKPEVLLMKELNPVKFRAAGTTLMNSLNFNQFSSITRLVLPVGESAARGHCEGRAERFIPTG